MPNAQKGKLENVTTNKLYPAYKTNKGTIIQMNNPKTDLPTGATLDALISFVDESGLKTVLITGGSEATGHSTGSFHGKNLAIDVAGARFNKLENADVLSAANKAGFTHGVYEDFKDTGRDHWHLQIGAGNGLGDSHLTTNSQMVTKKY